MLHPVRQDADVVVDAGDQEQERSENESDLLPFLRRKQRHHRGAHPKPDQRDAAGEEHDHRAQIVGAIDLEIEKERDHDEHQCGADDSVDHRENTRPDQVRGAARGRHERVFDRAFPSLPAHRFREHVEEHREIAPEHRADQEKRGDPGRIARGRLLNAYADEANAHRICDRVGEPNQLPHEVSFRQIVVPLDKPKGRDDLVHPVTPCRRDRGNHWSSSSSASASSNDVPVAAIKTSSSVGNTPLL